MVNIIYGSLMSVAFHLVFESINLILSEFRANIDGAMEVERSPVNSAGGVGAIRILKRPESASNLTHNASASKNVEKEKVRQDHEAVQQMSSGFASGPAGKSLQDRVTAYAEARQRIFGVIDPVIHEDLPLP